MENIDLVFMSLNSKLELQVFICGLKDLDKNAYPLDYNSTSFGSNCSSCHEQFKSPPVTQFAHWEASSWLKPDGTGSKCQEISAWDKAESNGNTYETSKWYQK